MRFARLRMHKWRKSVKVMVPVLVIVILIIVVAQGRPALYDRDKLQQENVMDVDAPAADIIHMNQEAQDIPIAAKPEVVPADNHIQIDPPRENKAQPPKQPKAVFVDRDFENENNDQKMDRLDADADAANAGPDRADENEDDGDDRNQEDGGDADAIADGAGKHQIDKPKEAIVDDDLRFANGPRDNRNHGQNHRIDLHDKLKIKDLQPDHLDAVKLEQDGHLNRDYKKEIFLGNHEELDDYTDEERLKKLTDIFHRVDADKDSLISLNELEEWIIQKVQEHFDEAHEENEKIFHMLDTDVNGFLDWSEFHVQFLMAKGHDKREAEKHAVDYETIPLEAEDKDQLIRFKFRWAEADDDPQDNQLDIDEFRSFRHPEQSRNMLTKMVQDIMDNLDRNNDDFVSEVEFAALPPGEVDEAWGDADKAWQDERKKEFRNVIDLNQDGKVTRDELKIYVDPSNPNHASLEAKNLISLADINEDGKLSLDEVLDNRDLFLGSKMVDTGRNFHDEF